jgi:hypothetical protein
MQTESPGCRPDGPKPACANRDPRARHGAGQRDGQPESGSEYRVGEAVGRHVGGRPADSSTIRISAEPQSRNTKIIGLVVGQQRSIVE